uniref:Uncharacterized protein n=1 Tax=Aegilops tauschii subsp. strangulata TaxID=200361 RepID=A0A453CW44_AEGTS
MDGLSGVFLQPIASCDVYVPLVCFSIIWPLG